MEVLFYQKRNGGIPPCGGNAHQAVCVIIKREGDIIHEFICITASQFHNNEFLCPVGGRPGKLRVILNFG